MFKNTMAAASLLLAAACAAPASAQETDNTFNGAYAGVQLGWGQRSATIELTSPFTDFDDSRSGLDYGIFAGYDATVGAQAVVGIEFDYGGGGKSLSSTPFSGITAEIEPGANYAITARAGLLATPQTLVYVRGGIAAENLDIRVTGSTTQPFGESGYSEGWLAGAGVEFAVGPKFSLRGEYRYKNLKGDYSSQHALFGAAYRF